MEISGVPGVFSSVPIQANSNFEPCLMAVDSMAHLQTQSFQEYGVWLL